MAWLLRDESGRSNLDDSHAVPRHEEQLAALSGPAARVAAATRDLRLGAATVGRPDIDFFDAGFIRFIRQPPPIGRIAWSPLIEPRRQAGLGHMRLEGQRPDVRSVVRATDFERHGVTVRRDMRSEP